MSWGALFGPGKAKTADFGKPQAVVYATDPELSETDRKLFNVEHETVSSITLPKFDKGLLILDANAIIKGMDNFSSISDMFVTTSQVVGEIRDKASKELMERLPHQLVVLDPTAESIREVVHMAERTGDLGVLSRTDIRLCALALDCCKAGGVLLQGIEPRPAEVNPNTSGNGQQQEEAGGREGGIQVMMEAVSDDEADPEEEEEEEEEAEADAPASSKPSRMLDCGSESGDDDDDDNDGNGEWITPENIHEMAADGTRNAKGAVAFEGGMACVTSDFAMQNTLMHLGIPIIGTNGMRITELRLWMLRCTGCFKLVMDTTRQFCPDCGSGDTLRRVNYVVNSNGERQLFINFKKQISTRGTIYGLPKPRGGKRGTNKTLVLREDQLAQVISGKSGAKMKERQAIAAFDEEDDLAGFGDAVHKKKRNLGDHKSTSSYKRYNINEKRKQRAGRRK